MMPEKLHRYRAPGHVPTSYRNEERVSEFIALRMEYSLRKKKMRAEKNENRLKWNIVALNGAHPL